MDSSEYIFQSPFATAIHPLIANPDATLALLYEINTSLPPSKRLPYELLLYVNKELHCENVVWKDIRGIWSPMAMLHRDDFFHFAGSRLDATRFDRQKKRYYFPEEPAISYDDMTCVSAVANNVSSADFLYRLRCFFPEVNINQAKSFQINRRQTIWAAIIQHNIGVDLLFTEWRAKPQLWCGYSPSRLLDQDLSKGLLEDFITDSIRLLNTLFEIAGESLSGQFAYYHPAAIADLQPTNERYISVPSDPARDRVVEDTYAAVYKHWCLWDVPEANVSVFRSLLHDLKYDVNSRKISHSGDVVNLTTIISSALLFYRLLCKYGHNKADYPNIAQTSPITSVWQVQLHHRKTDLCLIFMDDRGLFDIKTNGDPITVMKDIEQLVEGLCSDVCTHPYDCVLAGCEA